MITGDLPDSFDQLVVFGQRPDVKIRPVLLRVLVDMFVGKSHHSVGELQQFEEMMIHLLDDADDETRLAVAEKLSLNPHTPRTLLERFMAERGAIAAKVLTNAAMEPRSLNAAAVFGTAAMAQAVAGRRDLDQSIIRSLAERPEVDVLLALAENRMAPLDRPLFRYLARRSRGLPELAAKLAERGDTTGESTTLFFSANHDRRAELIAVARRQDLGTIARPLPVVPGENALAAIERAAAMRGVEGLDAALGTALGVSPAEVARLMDDPNGEPLALALASLGVSPQVAARIFILGDPSIGHSYLKVKSLVGIVETVSAHAAHKLVMAMLGRTAETPRRPVHQPVGEGNTARRAEVAMPRAAVAPPAQPVAQKGVGPR